MSGATATMPPVVVLTGGIASGKSAVSERFAQRGVPVIDTDILAREVVAAGTPGLAAVVDAFGPQVLAADGTLDRNRMRQLVFADGQARTRLEDLLHPRIEAAARTRIKAHADARYCLLVVPLLIESGLFADADCVVVVDVPEELQRQRLLQRDGVDTDTARRMLASQASRQQRLARADEVIDNQGNLEQLETQVERLHQRLLARFP